MLKKVILKRIFILQGLIFLAMFFAGCASDNRLEVLEKPNNFEFTPKTKVEPFTLIYSEEITLSGFSKKLGITLSGDETARININDTGYTRGGIVNSGDKIRLQVRSPTKFVFKTTIKINVGSLVTYWEVTTKKFEEKLPKEPNNEDLSTLKSASGFALFLSKSIFMPNDPRKMTQEQKNWFSQNATFDIQWSLVIENSQLTENQLNNTKMFLEGIMKTFNYIVYTKSFAKALYSMFTDRDFVSVSEKSSDNPSALGTILVLRALNTRASLGDKVVFEIKKTKNTRTYSAIKSPFPLSAGTDYFTKKDMLMGKKDFFKYYSSKYPNGGYEPHIYIPAGDPLDIPNFKDLWDYGCQKQKISSDDLSLGFKFNLVAHEFLHAFLGWGHPKEPALTNGTDLVYHTAGAISIFLDGQTNGQKLTLNVPKEENISDRDKTLMALFGGHLPMATLGCFIANYASYNVLSMYYYHQLGRAVYNPLPLGQLYRKFTPKLEDKKSIPKNPFEGLKWKLNYLGATYN